MRLAFTLGSLPHNIATTFDINVFISCTQPAASVVLREVSDQLAGGLAAAAAAVRAMDAEDLAAAAAEMAAAAGGGSNQGPGGSAGGGGSEGADAELVAELVALRVALLRAHTVLVSDWDWLRKRQRVLVRAPPRQCTATACLPACLPPCLLPPLQHRWFYEPLRTHTHHRTLLHHPSPFPPSPSPPSPPSPSLPPTCSSRGIRHCAPALVGTALELPLLVCSSVRNVNYTIACM